MATVMLVLVAVLAVALAAVVIGFILYTKDLRNRNRALTGELKEASAQLERRTKKAVGSARTSHVGLITEQLAPLLPRFPDCNLKDVQWIGGTIDMILRNGLEAAHAAHYPRGTQVEIVFVDVKTGGSSLSPRQRLIRDAIEDGRVRFEVFRFRPEQAAAIVTAADEEITFTKEELTGEWAPDGEVLDLGEIYPDREGSPPLDLQPLPGPDE